MILSEILKKHFATYKDIRVQDVYKLLYQGTFGCEHMVNEKSRARLYEEFEKAEPDEKESLIETISHDFFIYRINIRPYKACRGKKETLFEWFYKSSKIKEGTAQNFLDSWKIFREMNKQENYFPVREIEEFEKIIKKEYSEKKQLPVMHHSKRYRKANNPSYRVINYKAIHDYMNKKMIEK